MPLADYDTYQTPERRRRTLLALLSPWPELSFYLPVVGVVFRSSFLAVRGRYDAAAWVAASMGTIRAMEGVGMRLTVEGMGHLRALSGPAVIVGNHMSTLETFVLPSIVQPVRPMTFVVKESLIRYPVFGPVVRARDPIVVGRKNPRQDLITVLQGGQDRLSRGVSVVVFPQTTRTARFDPAQFNTIGVKLALRAGVPVIPLALKTDAWGNGKHIRDFGHVDPSLPVRFRFGAPIAPEGRGAEAHQMVIRFIQGALDEWSAPCRSGATVG